MTIPAKMDFKDRSRQVSSYLLWLSRQEKLRALPDGVLNTAKASALLLLYNLIESTSTNAIQNVFDAMTTRQVSYDQLTMAMKKIALDNLKRRKPGKMAELITSIGIDIYRVSFDREDVFSGNVDAKLLRDTMRDFGIRQTHDYLEPELLTLKTQRNELAHGVLSFADAGKEITARELIAKYWKVRIFFNNMLADYTDYINSTQYVNA
jgi:hypothetical protein